MKQFQNTREREREREGGTEFQNIIIVLIFVIYESLPFFIAIVTFKWIMELISMIFCAMLRESE
jgi:hypothetical protein